MSTFSGVRVDVAASERRAELKARRQRQKASAYVYLRSGDPVGSGEPPPYGDVWNRDYNPRPYPDAVPSPQHKEDYRGTGVGFLYDIKPFEESDPIRAFMLDLVGWNLVRSGTEVRGKKKSKFNDR